MAPIVATTSKIAAVQAMLYAPHGLGLHRMAHAMRRTPDGFSAELKAEHAAAMRQAGGLPRILRLDLPRDAANDEPRGGRPMRDTGVSLQAASQQPCPAGLAVGRASFPLAGAARHPLMPGPTRAARKAPAGLCVPWAA